MSALIDKGRALSARLLAKHGAPVTLTRVTVTKTNADLAAGRKGTETRRSISGKGILGSRMVKLSDGTQAQQSIATLTVEPVIGDDLKIGKRSFEVLAVREENPDGGTAFFYEAVLK